jgi:hypothetical protein
VPNVKGNVEDLAQNLDRKVANRCERALQLVVLLLNSDSSGFIRDLGAVVTVLSTEQRRTHSIDVRENQRQPPEFAKIRMGRAAVNRVPAARENGLDAIDVPRFGVTAEETEW